MCELQTHTHTCEHVKTLQNAYSRMDRHDLMQFNFQFSNHTKRLKVDEFVFAIEHFITSYNVDF